MEGKNVIAAAALLAVAATARAENPDRKYVEPTDPLIKERLEWFRDQKLGIMMHFGLYSEAGIIESWPLDDDAKKWSRREVDWTGDSDEFKSQYWSLAKSFNPIRIDAGKWADAAKKGGFRYLIFTSKHHDGFCLFDTKQTDFKTTSPDCPFSAHPRADILKHVFDEFRAREIPVMPYFSKPDWHSPDFWDNGGVGGVSVRGPMYKPSENPERWKRFCEFTKAQLLELATGYGRIEGLWLDGGWLNEEEGTGIGIEDMIAAVRKVQPWVISIDRWCGGPCEEVRTPEQTVPKEPMDMPWESCITIGNYWGYHYSDNYKSPRRLVHMLVDIVAKGGNLALNVGPQPDGRLPREALDRMAELGKWLARNGAAIYSTRPAEPWRKGDWAFTRNRHSGTEYAIRLWKEGEKRDGTQSLPAKSPAGVKKVVYVPDGAAVPFKVSADGASLEIDLAGLKERLDPIADAFSIVR